MTLVTQGRYRGAICKGATIQVVAMSTTTVKVGVLFFIFLSRINAVFNGEQVCHPTSPLPHGSSPEVSLNHRSSEPKSVCCRYVGKQKRDIASFWGRSLIETIM